VDKLDLFQELEKLAAGDDLDADEIRLYLLLLANCRGSRTGQIGYSTIKNAIGGEFTPRKLEKAFQHLFRRNLVAVTAGFPEHMVDDNFVLSYLILPAREIC
jgi:ABC-type microcin C transport system permease subunit YejB